MSGTIRPHLNIDLSNAVPLKCPCGGEYFHPLIELYKLPKVASPVGKAATIHKTVYMCYTCGKILDDKALTG